MTPGVSPVPLAAMAKLTLEGGKSDLKADLKAEGADTLEPPSTPARGDTDAAETAAETAETDVKRPGTSVDEGLAAALAAGEAMYGEHSGFQVSYIFTFVYVGNSTDAVFCAHRYWSPLSQVYNVPTVQPKAAYALVWCHVAAFTADLLSYKLAGGSGGDVFLRLALFDDAVVYDSQWLRLVRLFVFVFLFPCVWAIRVMASCFVGHSSRRASWISAWYTSR